MRALDRRLFDRMTQGIILVSLLACGCDRGGPAAADFSRGRQLVTQGQFEQSIPCLEGVLREHPQSRNASRAGLFLGKSFLALGKFDDAERVFQDTARRYPDSAEAHKCRYKLAVTALLQGDQDLALQRFRDLRQGANGPLVPEAVAFEEWLQNR